MPSRWDAATHGWSRRVFHYPLPTLMSRNLRLPRTIELQPLSLTPLKMRKVEASNEEIVDAVQQVRHQGGHEVHQQLQDSLEDTRNPKDMLTFEEIATAIEANGESPPPHAEIGKQIRRLWPHTRGARTTLDGRQVRVITGVKVKGMDC